jgi:hypothetical protein
MLCILNLRLTVYEKTMFNTYIDKTLGIEN